MKNENRIVHVCMFSLIAVVLFYAVTLICVPNWNYPFFSANTGMNINEFENLESDIEVFFAGTSHMENGVSPMQMYKDRGILTYNISTCDQRIEITEYLVKQIFANNYRPKLIVVDVSSLFFGDTYESAYRYVVDNEKIGLNKLELICAYFKQLIEQNRELEEPRDKNSYYKDCLGFVIPLYRYHSRWDSLNEDDFCGIDSDYYFMQGFTLNPAKRGASADIEWNEAITQRVIENQNRTKYSYFSSDMTQENFEVKNAPQFYNNVNEKNVIYLKEINNICKQYNCKLLLIKIPVDENASAYKSSWSHDRHDSVKDVADDLDIPFLDLVYEERLDIDWDNDTVDGGAHMNLSGAEKITRFLESYIVDNYNIDSTNNAVYDNKLSLYNKYINIAHIDLEITLPDYLRIIKETDEDLAVFIAAQDDMATSLSKEDIMAFEELGFKTDFGEIDYADSFIAVWDDGSVEYEGVSNRQQIYKTCVGNDNIIIKSAGYLDGNVSSIKVNEKEHSMKQRGINIVVYDKQSGLVIDRANCDTCSEIHNIKHDVGSLLYEYQEYLMRRK